MAESSQKNPKSLSNGKRGAKLPWSIAVAALIAAVVCGAAALVNVRNLEFAKSEVRALETQKREIQVQASNLRERLSALEQEMEQIAQTGNQAAEAALRRQRDVEKARTQQDETLEKYESALRTSRERQEALSQRIASLQNSTDSLTRELEKLRGTEEELREKLQSSTKLTGALQQELKGKERTLNTLEAAYQRYKNSNQDASRKLDQVIETVSDLESINRRRLEILEQASRRFRELSDNYRTLAVRIDSDTRGQSGFNAEVTRLQSAVLSLDDQLTQLSNLNTQASRLERKLEQARNLN